MKKYYVYIMASKRIGILLILCISLAITSCQQVQNPLKNLSYKSINDMLVDVTMLTGRDETCLDFFAGKVFPIKLSQAALQELNADCNHYAEQATKIFSKKLGRPIAIANVKDPSLWRWFLNEENKQHH